MSDALSKDLQDLDDFLLSDAVDDDAMLLSELDGFLAGVVVCPDLIKPSEWLPLVWGEEGALFESEQQAQTVMGLIMGRYNDIIRQLDGGSYRPLYDIDNDDTVLWETWIEGFWHAALLRPGDWLDLGDTDDEEVQAAVFGITRLYEMAAMPPDLEPLDTDEELEDLAPELIPHFMVTLHRARLARAGRSPAPGGRNRPKVGRNDPCPCGSGKKFKKCCLN